MKTWSSVKPNSEEAPEEGVVVEAVEEAAKGTKQGTIRDFRWMEKQARRLGSPTTATMSLTIPDRRERQKVISPAFLYTSNPTEVGGFFIINN